LLYWGLAKVVDQTRAARGRKEGGGGQQQGTNEEKQKRRNLVGRERERERERATGRKRKEKKIATFLHATTNWLDTAG
jgi:hypothetical protein